MVDRALVRDTAQYGIKSYKIKILWLGPTHEAPPVRVFLNGYLTFIAVLKTLIDRENRLVISYRKKIWVGIYVAQSFSTEGEKIKLVCTLSAFQTICSTRKLRIIHLEYIIHIQLRCIKMIMLLESKDLNKVCREI